MKCMHCFFFESVYEDYKINAHLVLFDSTDILMKVHKNGSNKRKKMTISPALAISFLSIWQRRNINFFLWLLWKDSPALDQKIM